MSPSATSNPWRYVWTLGGIALLAYVTYLLRGILVPLFVAFLVAYALDPVVDRLEALKVPRALGALAVMAALSTVVVMVLLYVVPYFLRELRDAAKNLPEQLFALQAMVNPWLAAQLHVEAPVTMSDWTHLVGRLDRQALMSTSSTVLFGTLGYVALALSLLVIPVFALYLLIDFDRIVARVGTLVPRRWIGTVSEMAQQIHKTLGGWVQGQLTTSLVLAALYAIGLRVVGIRLAVPIGILTGMLAFIPYVGFFFGMALALAMALFEWHGFGPVLGVGAVMLGVQMLDGMLITPRIVGRSVGLSPLEVILTMMGAATLFGFLGVFLAVPIGAVAKILIGRLSKAYTASNFYRREA